MTQLAETVTATDEFWTLDVLPTTQYVTVEDETVEVRAPFPSQYYTLTGETLPPRIRVRRGVGGTTAAGHNSGSALTAVYGLGGGAGGGAIAVTGGGTTVNDVTEIDLGAVPVSDAGGGVAAVQQSLLSTTVTLTNDQIKDLPFTPVVIVPSPGADVLIAPVSIWVVLDTPVAYTDVDAAFALTFLGGGLAGGGLDMAQYAEADDGFLSGGSGAFRPVIHIPIYMPVVGGIVTAFWVGRVGNRIEFQSSGQAVALTGGDAANTITVTVIYTTVTL